MNATSIAMIRRHAFAFIVVVVIAVAVPVTFYVFTVHGKTWAVEIAENDEVICATRISNPLRNELAVSIQRNEREIVRSRHFDSAYLDEIDGWVMVAALSAFEDRRNISERHDSLCPQQVHVICRKFIGVRRPHRGMPNDTVSIRAFGRLPDGREFDIYVTGAPDDMPTVGSKLYMMIRHGYREKSNVAKYFSWR
jgi:hypothetical protein